MKLIFLGLLLQFSTNAFTQNFNLSELIHINNYNLDKFDTYVTGKGYQFYKIENDKNHDHTIKSYAFNLNGNNLAYISKIEYKASSKKIVSFQTLDKATYLKIKAELIKLGYKYVDLQTDESAICLNYSKGSSEISLVSLTQDAGNNKKRTSYEISAIDYGNEMPRD